MSKHRRRLERLETSLSPRQTVLLWMDEAHGFVQRLSYVRWLIDQPDEVYPLVKMPKQVVAAVRAAGKGKSRDELDRQIYSVQRDVLFLFYLHELANERIEQEAEVLFWRMRLLLQELGTLLRLEALASDVARTRLALLRHEVPQEKLLTNLTRWELYDAFKARYMKNKLVPQTKQTFPELVREWQAALAKLRGEAETLTQALAGLSARYFSGRAILFPETEERLKLVGETTASLTKTAEEWIGEMGLPKAKAAGKKESTARKTTRMPLVPLLIDQARAKALVKLGEHGAAAAIAERQLRAAL